MLNEIELSDETMQGMNGLRQMPPLLAQRDITHLLACDAEVLAEAHVAPAFGVQAAEINHPRRGHPGGVDLWAFPLAAFGNHVGDILLVGAAEQMLRSDAERHVAPMQHVRHGWQSAHVKLESDSMGRLMSPRGPSSALHADGEEPVDMSTARPGFPGPEPMIPGDLDMSPKSSLGIPLPRDSREGQHHA